MDFKKNDLVEVIIEDMSEEGQGIGKVDGYTLFIKDALVGDRVQAKIMKLKKNYGFARLMEILEPSPYRVEPKCVHHKACGGCQLQALSYEEQLRFKENKVLNHLKRIGGFDKVPMEPIVGMDNPYHYRNKAQFPVGCDKEGNLVTGFYAARTHTIIPNMECSLGVDVNKTILEIILNTMKEFGVTAYDENTGKGLVRHILIRYGFTTKEIMVCLIINGKKLPHQQAFIDRLCKLEGMSSITLNFNKENTNVIMGDTVETIWGNGYITDYIGEIKYQISPLSFYQVNPVQTKNMYDLVLEYAGLTGKETVWDLYCGIGTISLFLTKSAKQVYGVEIVPQAIEDAKNNAKINGITNAEFYVGKAEEVVPEFYERAGKAGDFERADTPRCEGVLAGEAALHPEVIVVDPPRKGCDSELLKTIVKMAPDRVIYVSCDSSTLARDLKYLCGEGYELKKVRPVDNFCQTGHVETVVLLSKLRSSKSIEIKIELDEMDLTQAESKATYEEIKQYVMVNAGLNVSQLYIAQVKRKHGLIERVNYNVGSGKSKVPQVSIEKEKAIEDALRHFKMI